MRCSVCNQSIPTDSVFCQYCGLPVVNIETGAKSESKATSTVPLETPHNEQPSAHIPEKFSFIKFFANKTFWKIGLALALICIIILNIIGVSYLAKIHASLDALFLKQSTPVYSNSNTKVYVYIGDEYYHAHNKCRYGTLCEITLENAVNQGYRPCRACKPEILH